jgi:NAD(P)-dependent dehydrogenase (short-subunit alcohol dehydrogenase family)
LPAPIVKPGMNTKTPPGAAIVTGASRGLGFGIAQQLADAGHPAVLVACGADELDRATAAIRDAGREALAIQADVTREEDIENLAAVTLAGGVGKAAATGFGAAEGLTAEEWIERRLGTETLTPAQVGDAVIALLESESGTWSVTPAGLEEWDPIAAPVVPR